MPGGRVLSVQSEESREMSLSETDTRQNDLGNAALGLQNFCIVTDYEGLIQNQEKLIQNQERILKMEIVVTT